MMNNPQSGGMMSPMGSGPINMMGSGQMPMLGSGPMMGSGLGPMMAPIPTNAPVGGGAAGGMSLITDSFSQVPDLVDE